MTRGSTKFFWFLVIGLAFSGHKFAAADAPFQDMFSSTRDMGTNRHFNFKGTFTAWLNCEFENIVSGRAPLPSELFFKITVSQSPIHEGNHISNPVIGTRVTVIHGHDTNVSEIIETDIHTTIWGVLNSRGIFTGRERAGEQHITVAPANYTQSEHIFVQHEDALHKYLCRVIYK